MSQQTQTQRLLGLGLFKPLTTTLHISHDMRAALPLELCAVVLFRYNAFCSGEHGACWLPLEGPARIKVIVIQV